MLDRVVAPLAVTGPVLLLVLDGLSFAVFRELAADLPSQGWEEIRPVESSSPFYGVGLLPTVTQVCRTSLFCGDRRMGNATEESRGFNSHSGLRRHGSLASPPVLFHKENLEKKLDLVIPEVDRPTRRVVGVVLNVVDDQLPKGRQLVPRWRVEIIRYLIDLLQAAQGAGRTLILTADHGHLVERETELRRHEGAGARYRVLATPPGEGEVAVRGPRVLLDEGKGLVLAWSERLRFAALQAGYHGGASPQEVIVPLSVWVPAGAEIPGWLPAGPELPAWWREDGEPDLPSLAPTASSRTRSRTTAPAGQRLLFGEPERPDAAPAAVVALPRPAWLTDLFASPVYREQLERAGRQSLIDEKVEEVLRALDAHGGQLLLSALARQLGISPPRTQGLVAVLQRVLNVEGFSVLALDPGSETVSLDRGLLSKQFPCAEERA